MAANTATAQPSRSPISSVGSMAAAIDQMLGKSTGRHLALRARSTDLVARSPAPLLSTKSAAATAELAALRARPSEVGRMEYFVQQLINGRHARLDLRPDRHRLHDGLRHHRHDQFRPRRHLHGRRLHRADRLPGAGGDRRHRHSARALPGAADRHGADRALRLDGRALRLPAAARQLPPGAADLGDRHVDHPAELRADRAGRARQAAAAADHRRPHADRERSASTSSFPTSRSSSWSPRWR